MKETERMALLLADLYKGQPWLDVNISGTLEKITAGQAAGKLGPGWNSIWEIVNHLISWRGHVLANLQGKGLSSPAHNYFIAVEDISATAWKKTLQAFDASQNQWLAYLETLDERDLEKKQAPLPFSPYQYIHGILQHDAYHLGQIAMLSRHA